MYKIKIKYKTGNSFNTYTEESTIEYEWTNLEMVKESIQRIKNHYHYYNENPTLFAKPKEKLPVGVKWCDEFRMLMLALLDDNGKEFLYSSFWTGYFESLIKAQIIVNEPDMVFEPY